MNFVSQHKESKDVINLEMCSNFYTMKLSDHKQKFIIRFTMGTVNDDRYESWYYEKEADRDLQFKYICELVKVKSIGN